MVERQFSATGEMGRRIVAFDWESTPLGNIHHWPQSLKTAVRIILSARYPMFVWWGDELINLYNDAYIPVLGGRHPEALGRPAEEVWHEIWPEVGPQAERVLRDHESTWQEETLLLMQRNDYVEETYFTYSYSPLSDDDGTVRGVFCACTEDTDRVLGERRLGVLRRVSEVGAEASTVAQACAGIEDALRKAQLDVSFALLYLFDPGGTTAHLAANTGVSGSAAAAPASIDLRRPEESPWDVASALAGTPVRVDDLDPGLGLPGGAWPEPAATAFVLPLGRDFHDEPVGFLVAGASPRRSIDETYERFFDLMASGVAGAVGNARAFEEERQRADVLTELDRAKTTFFSNVSHEFRTPLTLMLAPLEDAAATGQGLLDPDDVELVRRNGQRMLKLVNSMLDFARIEAGRSEAEFEPMDLAAETSGIASAFSSIMETAGLQFDVDCLPLTGVAYVDRAMWEKIVLNLVSNAYKHTFEGTIRVSLDEDADTVVFRVSDTGSGIPAEDLPHIFDRFHRVHGVRSRTHEGTGIGLALVNELVKMHGGTIGVESQMGLGSVFTVRIPLGRDHLPAANVLAKPDAEATPSVALRFVEEAARWTAGSSEERRTDLVPLSARAPLVGGPIPRVLIADDGEDMRRYLERLFTAAGYRVTAVADGEQALAAMARQRPDIVISDIMMPILGGLELIRRVRSIPSISDLPIVLLSARAGEEARVEGLEAGADDYVVKPFSARELLVRISGLITLARVRAESARRERQLKDEATVAIRATEQRFRRMADTAPVLVWVSDATGQATYLSQSWFEFTGQDPREGEGAGWQDVIHPDHLEATRDALLSATENQEPFQVETKLRRADGSYRWVTSAGTPHFDDSGRFLGFIGTIIDITERREAEAALRTSEAQFRTLANSIPQLAWMARPDGWIFWYNQRWYDYTGTTLAEMEGWGWKSVHDADAVEGIAERFKRAVDAGESWEDTFLLRRHDGAMRPHLSRALPLRDESGETVLWFGTNTDITDRIEMEEALREADRRKDEFLATLAHELRNPLAPLAHGVEVLSASPGGRTASHVRRSMRRQLGNIVRLVDDLLDLSRVNLGKFELHHDDVDLGTILRMAAETVRPALAEREHEFTLDLPPRSLTMVGDSTRLEQIFSNLLENAAKYTDPGGHIELRAEVLAGTGADGGEQVRVTVADNGIGISADALGKIFDMFSQGERAIAGENGGLGIGLTIVRQLVAMHGGTIEARSAGEGHGSEFIVTLGLAEAAAEAAQLAAANGAPEADAAVGRRVLVVDDNEDAAVMLSDLISIFGHQVATAHDGQGALDLGETVRPEIVFLDIGMPQLDGYATCRLMRERDWGQKAKICALTGWGQDKDKDRSREAGFDEHLVKPVELGVIKQLLREVT